MVERKKDDIMQAADDVATLYSWANLHGAKYRDFSASRQELRAQSRHRMLAEQDALAQEAVNKTAQENSKPAAEAVVKPEPAQTLAEAPTVRTELRPEMRPLGESMSSQPRAAVQYERMPATPVERMPVPPAQPAAAPFSAASAQAAAPVSHPAQEFQDFAAPAPSRSAEQQRAEHFGETQFHEVHFREQQLREQQHHEQQLREQQHREQQYREQQFREQQFREQQYRDQHFQSPQYPYSQYTQPQPGESRYGAQPPWDRRNPNRGPEFTPPVERRVKNDPDFSLARPAWHNSDNEPFYGPPVAGSETLQQSRERVASRWFALKGVFDHTPEQDAPAIRVKDVRVPALAVFSLAGGVGKTSLVATLGRSLAALGERVLLADTSSYGLLPYYFGARDLRPGVVRTFTPPGGGTDAPVNLLNVDTERHEGDPADMEWLAEDLQRNARGSNRILIDLATASASLTRRALRTSPVVLVPIIPDMNSIVTLSVVDGFFRNHPNAEGRPVQPYYILNQFDPSLPLHLDVREVLRQQLGERLLPFVLRRSQGISEALAEGMTVVDYASGSMIADDFLHLANWLRSISAPASLGYRGVRWSER